MKAKPVTEFDDFLMQLVERMIHLMGDAQGVGLAATQLGILQRIFVFEHEEKGAQAVVNPQLADASPRRRPTRKAASRSTASASRSSVRPRSPWKESTPTGSSSASSSKGWPPASSSTRSTTSTAC